MGFFNKSDGISKDTRIAINRLVAYMSQHQFVSVTNDTPQEVEHDVKINGAKEVHVITPDRLTQELIEAVKDLRGAM